MKTLAQRILDILPEYPLGPTVAEASARLAAQQVHIRAAFDKLDAEQHATLVRRKGGRTFYLVPLESVLACKNCHAEYERPKKSKRLCCSRACGIAWSWRRPGVAERRTFGIRKAKATPESKARQVEINNARWAKPEEHAKMSEHNKRQWRDPVTRAKRSAGIQAAQGTPEKRKLYSDLRKDFWDSPEGREKMVKGIRAHHQTPEARARFSKLLKDRWTDPVMRAKYTAGNRRRNEERFAEPTVIQAAVLETIRGALDATGVARIASTEIARRIGKTNGTVRGALGSLERRGFISRERPAKKTAPHVFRILAPQQFSEAA